MADGTRMTIAGDNYLRFRPILAADILRVSGLEGRPIPEEMIHNDIYAICMCRVKYLRAKGGNSENERRARKILKQNYNSSKGKGTVEKYLRDNK